MAPIEVKVEANGRILIPADVRRQLGVQPGDVLLLGVGDDGVRLWTRAMAARDLQALVSRTSANEGVEGADLDTLRQVSGPPANTEVGKHRGGGRTPVGLHEDVLVDYATDDDDDEFDDDE